MNQLSVIFDWPSYFSFNEQLKSCAQLSLAWKKPFLTSKPVLDSEKMVLTTNLFVAQAAIIGRKS